MSVTRDIVQSWRRPRVVIRRLLSMGRREDRALMFLLVACGLIFVAQWPRLSREAFLDPSVPLEARLSITFFAMLMVWPILLYLLAGLSHLMARGFGGKGTWYSSRLALFWALLASSPAWLLYGLMTGFIGESAGVQVVGLLVLGAFLGIWIMGLIEAESAPEAGVQ